MKESDWKTFKIIREKAIEQFCTRTLDEFKEVITNTDEDVRDRYALHYELVRDRDKQMSFMFDGLSRSKAPMQLVEIRAHGLADEALLAELSEEFFDQTTPNPFRKE